MAKFIIIVPTEKDKKALKKAFKHIHDADIDTSKPTVNALAHQYLEEEDGGSNIIVNKKLYLEGEQNRIN